VWLKDPITARIPSSFQVLKGCPPLWTPPTIPKTMSNAPIASTTTPTITTTGCPPLHLSAQFDGVHQTTQTTDLFFQRSSGRIPLRASSHRKSKQHSKQNKKLQAHQAGAATLSEHQLGQTKQRTLRLCQMVPPGAQCPAHCGTFRSLVLTTRLSRWRGEHAEEHTHSHIYVPSNARAAEGMNSVIMIDVRSGPL
jgi:hypothetical protein